MTDLHQALVDIRSMRRQMAQTTEFRGYGPLTLWSTAGLALLAGWVQSYCLAGPASRPALYVALWLSTAVISVAMIATEMLLRANRLHSGMANEMMRAAVLQFLPAGVAGAILPFLLLRTPGAVWTLPGLWQIVFSLGVFASCRCMPRGTPLVGCWFLLTGFGCLSLGDARALAPACMAGAYAVGLGMVAIVHSVAGKRGAA